MKLRKVAKAGLVTLALSPVPAVAQSTYVDTVTTASPSGSVNGALMPLPVRGGYFWARGDFGERPGVDGDYFSSGAFIPVQILGPDNLFLLDGQVWVDDTSSFGGDIGTGYRQLLPGWRVMAGVNGFVTWDHSQQEYEYGQVSLGGELLTDYLGLTSRVYVPFNDDLNDIGNPILTNDAMLRGDSLVLRNLQLVEQQMGGADIELGSPIPGLEFISAYVGGYFFDADEGQNVDGAYGRLSMDLTTAQFDLTISDDDTFGTTVNFGAEFRFGQGPLFCFKPRKRNLDIMMNDRVRRRSRIMTQQFLDERTELAINPATGQPFEFVHVDNTAGPGGDGSFEDRFNNLGLANGSAADIILVYRGTTSRTNLLPAGDGLVLSNNQIVIGEGTDFPLRVANRRDPVTLEGFTGTGTNPFVTSNPGTDIITLADNNQIAGLNLIAPAGGNMIGGTGVRNFTVSDINSDILAAESTGAGGGIFLTNAYGSGRITGFNYRADNVATATGGIVIRNTNAPTLSLSVADSTFIEGGQFGVDLSATNSDISATISNVMASQNGTGARFQARNGAEVSVSTGSSTFNDSVTGPGILVNSNSGGMVALTGNETFATGAATDGLAVNLDQGSAITSFVGGSFADANDDAVDASLTNNSQLFLNLNGTSGFNAGDRAFEFTIEKGSAANTNIVDGNFSMAGTDGVGSFVTGSSKFAFTATDSSFINAGRHGFLANGSVSSQIQANLTNTSFENAGADGIVTVLNKSTANLNLDNTNFDGAGLDGFRFESVNNSKLVASLENGVSFDNVGDNAFMGLVTSGSTASISGTGVSASTPGGDVFNFVLNNGALNLDLDDSGPFTDAGSSGIQINNANGGFASLAFDGADAADFRRAGEDAVNVMGTGNSQTFINFDSGAMLDQAGDSAIAANAKSESVISISSATGTMVSGAGAGGNAIDLSANDSVVALDITAGKFNNAGQDGISFAASNDGMIVLEIDGAPGNFAGAGGHGLMGTLQDSSASVTLSDLSFDNAALDGHVITGSNSTLLENLTNVTFNNAGLSGFVQEFEDGSNTGTTLDGVNALNVGLNAFMLRSDTGSTVSVQDGPGGVMGRNAGKDGVNISADGGTVNFMLSQATNFANSGDDGIQYDAQNKGTVNINIGGPANFTDGVTSSGYGVKGTLNNSTANISIADSTFDNAGSDGFLLFAENSSVANVALNDTTFNNAGQHAVNVHSLTGSNVAVNGDGISGRLAGVDGIHLVNNASTMNFNFTNIGAFDNAGEDGVDAIVSNGAHPNFQLNLSGTAGNQGQFHSAGQDGISLTFRNYDGFDASAPTFMFDQLNLSFAGDDGLGIMSLGFSPGAKTTFNGVVTQTNMNSAQENGFEAILNGNDPESMIYFENSTMANAAVDAVHIEATNKSFFDIDIIDGDLSGAGDDPVDIFQDGGSMVDIFIDPTRIDGGFEFHGTDGTVLEAHILDSPLSLAGRRAEFGVIGTLEDGATMNLIVENSVIDFATTDGVNVTAKEGSTFNAQFINSRIFESGRRGMYLDLNNSKANVSFTQNSTVTGSGSSNMTVLANNSSIANIKFDASSSNLSDAGLDGAFLVANGAGSAIDLSFAGPATVNNAARDGLSLNAVAGGRVNVNAQQGLTIDGAGDNA
ncbi:MAG: inverse autotransporter beta domain-containing protein, partial [Planctomycetaceae bacterium]|nr:inverse autotransporter beta domain-containing protein [Planctomycetaceae bacterium]